MHINFEFKAKTNNINELEQLLMNHNPVFKGEDHQVDTYFNVNKGRLKMREGNIENSLIYYERPDTTGPKQSDVLLYELSSAKVLKEILKRVHGIKVIVDKKRKIYFIDNVKFHFDSVKDLGSFVEVEAIDITGNLGIEMITKQCNYYANIFGIKQEDYIGMSYSDLIVLNSQPTNNN